MTTELERLIEQGKAIAGYPVSCTSIGHNWVSFGGRECPKGAFRCSQAAYKCERCGEYDYGDDGGPAYQECFVMCDWLPDDIKLEAK